MFKFHTLFLIVLSGCLLFLCSCEKGSPDSGEESSTALLQTIDLPDGKIDISIYYAGHPKTKREKDFVALLSHCFTQVETGDLADYNGSQSEGFDVTILDYDGDGFESPRPRIPRDFSKPVVTMGVTGAFICGQLNLKMDYL
jgi:hypothetical protein